MQIIAHQGLEPVQKISLNVVGEFRLAKEEKKTEYECQGQHKAGRPLHIPFLSNINSETEKTDHNGCDTQHNGKSMT